MAELNAEQQNAIDEFLERHPSVEVVDIDRITHEVGEPDVYVRLSDGWQMWLHADGTGSAEKLPLES